MEKDCPLCHRKFGCAEDESCWCFKVKADRKSLGELRKQCHDCICKECLLSMSKREK